MKTMPRICVLAMSLIFGLTAIASAQTAPDSNYTKKLSSPEERDAGKLATFSGSDAMVGCLNDAGALQYSFANIDNASFYCVRTEQDGPVVMYTAVVRAYVEVPIGDDPLVPLYAPDPITGKPWWCGDGPDDPMEPLAHIHPDCRVDTFTPVRP